MSRLLVYEKSPKNAAVFARLSGLKLSEVRSLGQLREAVADGPAAVAIETTMDELLAILQIVHDAKSSEQLAVIAMPEAAVRPQEYLLYEAGVDFVFWSMLDRDKMVKLLKKASRPNKRQNEESDPTAANLPAAIWDRLPWKRHATGGSSKS